MFEVHTYDIVLLFASLVSFACRSCNAARPTRTFGIIYMFLKPFVIVLCLLCWSCALQALHTPASHHRLCDHAPAMPFLDNYRTVAPYYLSWRPGCYLSGPVVSPRGLVQRCAVDQGWSTHRCRHMTTALQEHLPSIIDSVAHDTPLLRPDASVYACSVPFGCRSVLRTDADAAVDDPTWTRAVNLFHLRNFVWDQFLAVLLCVCHSVGQLCPDQLVEFSFTSCRHYTLLLELSGRVGAVQFVLWGCMLDAAALSSMQQGGAPSPIRGRLLQKLILLPYRCCFGSQLCSDSLVEFSFTSCRYYSLLWELSGRVRRVLLVVLGRLSGTMAAWPRQGGAMWQVGYQQLAGVSGGAVCCGNTHPVASV